jgi:hypothetical protein
MHRPISPRVYLAMLGMFAVAAFALVWIWVASAPLAFLESEYPAWLAKERLLARCDLGALLVVGDSRAAVDIDPRLLPVQGANLAVGGGEPIEAYFAIRRALACPNPPTRVVVSFDAGHFMLPDLFWERSVGFGLLDRADVEELRQISERLGDASIYGMARDDGLPAPLRTRLYAMRFPSLYFGSLLRGGVFLRWWGNRQSLHDVMEARGQYFFGTANGSNSVAVEGHLSRFRPLPVLDWYFDRMLALLASHAIQVDFVAMPMNDSTWREVRPELREGFAAYLADYAARYPNFHVAGAVMPHWPDRYFGDSFAHLNPAGTSLFSKSFAAWLATATASGRREVTVAKPPASSSEPGAPAVPPSSHSRNQGPMEPG